MDALERLNQQDRTEIAHFVIDPVTLFILGISSRRCMTVSDIAPAVNLPIATCYKMVYQMENMGLMAKCGVSRTAGRGKAATYTSVVKTLNLELRGGYLTLTICWKNGQTLMFKRDLSAAMTVPAMCMTGEAKDLPVSTISTVPSEVHDFVPENLLAQRRLKVS
jgi:hypothetical protein